MSAVNINEGTSELVYNVVVIDNGSVVLGESYPTPSHRRNAVIELLKQNHDEISAEEIEEVLLPFGGASADIALQRVVDLFTNVGVPVLVMVSEKPAQPNTLFHLFLTCDGEVQANEVFKTSQDRADWLIAALTQGVYGDSDNFQDELREQDEEALAADYPEGVSPSLPTNVERVDMLKNWLSEEGFDLYLDTFLIPKVF